MKTKLPNKVIKLFFCSNNFTKNIPIKIDFSIFMLVFVRYFLLKSVVKITEMTEDIMKETTEKVVTANNSKDDYSADNIQVLE